MTTNPKPNKALKVGEAERVPQGGGGAVAEPCSMQHPSHVAHLFF